MTSIIDFPPASSSHNIPADVQPTTQSRKKRRRTAGGGAQDDCFACRKIGSSCDRKRPYCTQCIEIGKECTGYKTTLTWGVGVASRGKLRGLSLPVASKQTATPPADGTTHERKRRKSSVSKSNGQPSDLDKATKSTSAATPITIPRQNHAPTSYPMSAATQAGSWQPSPTSYPMYGQYGSSRNVALKHIQTSLPTHFDNLSNYPHSASSTGSFIESDYNSPVDYTTTPSSYTFPEHHQQPFATYLDTTIEHSSPAAMDVTSATTVQPSLDILADYNAPFLGHSAGSYGQSYAHLPEINEEEILATDAMISSIDEEEIVSTNSTIPSIDARFSNHLFHLPQRLRSLINYYDTSICPFLVTFDTPQNPYRMHVIQLAAHNEGLQNALAALATNNMRMRRKEHRTIGCVEEPSDDSQPSAEESHYKQVSIEQLNMQLAQPFAAQDDSVLATLLILCLFHVCDSGFSKFKTQLAGVQKLMSLRDPNTKSPFTGWVEMFFIWFDVMTAAVNDREPQIKGESLDMMDFSVNLGALEQYSGCDGRLFKLIARLGGLSLLAQGRTTSRSTTQSRSMQSPQLMLGSFRKSKPRSLNAADYEHLDGNGWGTPVLSPDEELAPVNDRNDFWNEWNAVRARLQAWQVDASTISTDPTAAGFAFEHSLTPDQNDLVHISESFRHSALLYTERLAYPLLPSSAQSFQHHVAQALYHITSLPVTSCVNKFLLWPLFITGTECVDNNDRAVVRTRCIEIQRESGFYNNISCLNVLEKVWADVDMGHGEEGEIHARRRDSEVLGGSESRQAFRWRRAMDRVDGEYLII
ncbi:hypothetical protein AMS68_002842 [Peltaster fructicola]|uniref:Zn(2)-C6 fungal-type domain-containing protein n=1 Tax=Peltaster fructicola TaxID=286661 RepID=A0A6H0XRR7_9PEZI|nr:hypothetical protein AMS68_002842 [Peltaster fructicola]